jgi:hypothetical protein
MRLSAEARRRAIAELQPEMQEVSI